MRPRTAWKGLAAAAALGVWLVNVSVPGGVPVGCPSACAAGAEPELRPVRLLSLNLHHGFPGFADLARRLEILIGQVEALGVDVLVLQEVPWTPSLGNAAEHLAEALGMNHVYARANGNKWTILFEEGLAILSRFPLEEASITVLEPEVGWFEQRIVLQASVVTPQGALPVATTHLTQHHRAENPLQTASLRRIVAGRDAGPLVVAGDLNAEEDAPQIAALSREWRDAFRALHPEVEGATCCVRDLGARGAALRRRFDYVLVRPGIEVLRAEVVLDEAFRVEGGWLRVSDHAGVLVEIALRGEGP